MAILNVAMADMKVVKSPEILTSILGSCVGITLYDPTIKIGGLSHIMLPNKGSSSADPMKYADTAIHLLIGMMIKMGAKKENLVAKLVGGADMFSSIEVGRNMEIGKRNAETAEEILKKEGIKIAAKDILGTFGRSIEFNTANGKITIKKGGKESFVI